MADKDLLDSGEANILTILSGEFVGCNKQLQPMGSGDEPWRPRFVLENVWIEKQEGYEDWEPHVQGIKHEDGKLSLRFCYWKRSEDGTRGSFVHVPMFVYDDTLERLREKAKK